LNYIFIVLKNSKGNIGEDELRKLLNGLNKPDLSIEKITILNADRF